VGCAGIVLPPPLGGGVGVVPEPLLELEFIPPPPPLQAVAAAATMIKLMIRHKAACTRDILCSQPGL